MTNWVTKKRWSWIDLLFIFAIQALIDLGFPRGVLMSTVIEHDTHVFRRDYKWWWNCPCGAKSLHPFPRRMDADDDAYLHDEGEK